MAVKNQKIRCLAQFNAPLFSAAAAKPFFTLNIAHIVGGYASLVVKPIVRGIIQYDNIRPVASGVADGFASAGEFAPLVLEWNQYGYFVAHN